ncbi:hypothetical protein [Haliscomenobacter sp.]|uniref:hypothetical protein n=1 Tax=Haliscomenobacter sp. TaxID=2717303 RepID=UPI00359401F3
MRRKPIDYDALLKDFISDFFPDFIAFANPDLYAAIDWEKGYTFLEQELINAMRGRFKVRGKKKKTDKLVKVALKVGADHYVFVHGEFQHKPEPDFALRMYNYRALIGLRYDIESITAVAVFTGAKPAPNQLQYVKQVFGTSLVYQFNSIVAIQLDESALIQAIDNPFAVAMLAAQYAYRSRNNPVLRLELKTKLFDLLRTQGTLNLDRNVKLLIFVRDFVHLPKKLENEFLQSQFSLVFPNEAKMIISQGTKDFAAGFYERAFGYNPAQLLAEEQKKNEAKLAQERQKAEEERLLLQAALQRAEEERQKLQKTILNLHQLAKMSPPEIAVIVGMTIEEIEALITLNDYKEE